MDFNEDEIVISGIAGRYPECDSFDEFKEALLQNIDMITVDSRRWEPGTYDLPVRTGKINNVEYFDAGYFGVSPRQAEVMDPKHRIMFETAFEAIVDSGFNPHELRGTKTGVYIGIGGFDNAQALKELENTCGYAIIGVCLGQIANRTSYCFDFKGPSFVLDTACSSGIYAFANAVKAMERGDIDGAIVSAVNINLHPHESKEFNLLNMLAADGKCKVFSTDRDGYARSEAIVTVLLQRRSKCRRIYSTVLGADMNSDGWKVEGITFPSAEGQSALIRSIYETKNLNPNDVTYVEMHGTGTPAGDIIECESIVDIFCQNRKVPLHIGAVKSNMGHSEVSSGLCSLSKVLIAMETGIIPANLHCESIDYSLPGINSGMLKVVSENLPWNGGMVSLNCFGFGGANAHVVLKSNEQNKLQPKKSSHRLVNVSGRTEESVKHYLEQVEKHQDDREFLALVDEIHKIDVDGHNFRGYAVVGENPTSQIKKVGRENRPLWFIYSGMGSQWTGMSKDLMKIDIYRNTIKRCAKALEPYNVDLENILTSDDPKIFDDISNCFSAITASEIALTDVIKAFGIEPDNFAGHSLGEVGCAYCNGDLTPEEAMLLGFARGYATKKSASPAGQMAAVGLGKNEISKLLPEGVYIACVNGKNSVTITGLQENVRKFVTSLNEKGIFAREVATAGHAFHSKYIDDAAPHLQEFAAQILKDPQARSPKWVSSSRKVEDWDLPDVKLNCAQYHRNNYRFPVLFDQVLERIPKNAIVVEIAPHGLLTSVLKRELGPEVTCLSLANKNSKDNLQFLLSNIGQIFINGGQPNLRSFYNDVPLPVGRGTKNIGSLIKWDHSIKWYTPYFEPNKSFGKKVTINTDLDNYSYLKGHNIDGRVLMAATGYLELVWKVLADINAKSKEQCPVVFESVKFLRATVLPDSTDISFYINIMKQSGYFEIFEGGSVCCSGTVRISKRVSEEFIDENASKIPVNGFKPLLKQDIYKWFHLKRYMYTGLFEGMETVDVSGTTGKLKWNKSFTSFMDTMLQVPIIVDYGSDMRLPTRLQKVVIDPVQHMREVSACNDVIPVYHDKDLKVIRSGGIEITNLEVLVAPKRQNIQADPILESHTFVPYITNASEPINLELSLRIALQIVLENNGFIKNLNTYEIVSRNESTLADTVKQLAKTEPLLKMSFVDGKSQKADLILSSDGQFDKSNLALLNKDGFVLISGLGEDLASLELPIVYQNAFKGRGVYLLRNTSPVTDHVIIDVNQSDFKWIEKLKTAIAQHSLVYVRNHNDFCSGVLGLVRCISMEPLENSAVKCVFIKDDPSNINDDSCHKQLSHQLIINVLSKGQWGSYRHIPINGVASIEVSHASNYIQNIGDLSSFKWVERPSEYEKLSPDSEYVYVHYAALNFRDVMVATGKLTIADEKGPSDPDIIAGLEYSGVTKSGKRVMGIGSCCISLQTLSDPLFSWEVPQKWNLEEAATVPVVYATCYYGLIMRGQLKEKESVLIHAGAGGIGIAAISIALSLNCEVFTTVGSQEKKDFLLNLFPTLKAVNIGNSRSASFERMIMKNTKGVGVDVVLNSLSADLFQASIRCVARRGRFVEIGKVDLWAGTPVSASLFAKNTSFHGVLLDDLFTVDENSSLKKEINALVSDGISKGVIQPLPRTVFTEDQVENAYRFLSTGKHKGKVLIQIRKENAIQSPHRTIKALPKIYFHPDKTYVLVGGLGGFGLELTNFLIKRCARKIVLNSRRGWSNGYQSLCFKKWGELKGVTVKINTDDSSTMEGAQSLVNFAEQLGPIGGVFNMALFLEDGLFVNQTPEQFESVFRSKIYSGSNLDKITRAQCPKLDHFVVFSSIASGRGNRGQTNYGMANSALERLCEQRLEDGLPGLAVQFGPIGDVGVIVGTDQYRATIEALGLDFQTISSCINALETFMLQPYAVGSTLVLNEQSALSSASTKTPVETVAHILGIKDITRIDKNQPLTEIGLDSLMSAEIKQTLYRNFNIEIAVEDLRDLTFKKIEAMSDSSQSKSKESVTTNGHSKSNFNAMLPDKLIVEIVNKVSYSQKIFFLSPIEGHMEIMLPLAYQLKANIYGLQFAKELDFDNLSDYAKHFTKIVRSIQHEGPYFICCYSFGSAVGFEMALELEKLQQKVRLFFIDGSPTFVKKVLEEKLHQRDILPSNSRTIILQAFLQTFDDIDYNKAEALLDDSLKYNEQLSKLGNFFSENGSYKSNDVVISADRFIKRLVAGFLYQPCGVFSGEATLVRSDDVLKDLSADYDLQKSCKQPIKLEKLKGDHKQILQGDNVRRIAELINNTL